MWNPFFFFLILAILFSCGEKPKEEVVKVKGKALVTLPVKPETVKGIYTGNFNGSPISIVLNYVSNQHASGYNVHKGLTRNLSGTIRFANGKLQLQLAEPGNNPYDGLFSLEIDTATGKGKGAWKPLKKGEPTSFTFTKKILKEFEGDYDLVYTDTLSNYLSLKPDGACTFSYLTDTTEKAQQLTIRGSYQREKGIVTIFWQKNTVFPSGKSVFRTVKEKPYPEEDFEIESLKGEGRVFSEISF